jgi:hypothetical protein
MGGRVRWWKHRLRLSLEDAWYAIEDAFFALRRYFVAILAVVGAVVLAAIGYYTGAASSKTNQNEVLLSTRRQTITVRRNGRRVVVVRVTKVHVRPETIKVPRTVMENGSTSVVTDRVVRLVPVTRVRTRTYVTTRNGRVYTVTTSETVTEMTTQTETQTRTETQTQTSTARETTRETQTETQVVTRPPETTTVTEPVKTETIVTTVAETVTETLPPSTVTETTTTTVTS